MFAAFMTNISRNSDGRSAGHSRNDNDNADADIEMGAPPIRNASYAAGIIESVVGSARLSFKPSTQHDLESGAQKSAYPREMSQTHRTQVQSVAHTYPPASQPSQSRTAQPSAPTPTHPPAAQPSQSHTQPSVPTPAQPSAPTPPHSPQTATESRPLLSPVRLPNDSQLGEPVPGTGLMVVDAGPVQGRSFRFDVSDQLRVAKKPSISLLAKRPRGGVETREIQDITSKAKGLEETLHNAQNDMRTKEELWKTKEDMWKGEYETLKNALGALQKARNEEQGKVAEMASRLEQLRTEDQRVMETKVQEANKGNEELKAMVHKAETRSEEMYAMLLEMKGELKQVRVDLDTEKKEKEEALALLQQARAEVERMTSALDELRKARDEKEAQMQQLLTEVGKMGEEVQESRRQLAEARREMEAEVERVTNLLEEMKRKEVARLENLQSQQPSQPLPQMQRVLLHNENQPPPPPQIQLPSAPNQTQAPEPQPSQMPGDFGPGNMDLESFVPSPAQVHPPLPQQTSQARLDPLHPEGEAPPHAQAAPQRSQPFPIPSGSAPREDEPLFLPGDDDVDMDDLTARPRGGQQRPVIRNPIQPSEVRAGRAALWSNSDMATRIEQKLDLLLSQDSPNRPSKSASKAPAPMYKVPQKRPKEEGKNERVEWVRCHINLLLGMGTSRTSDTARVFIDDYMGTGTILHEKMLAYDTYRGIGVRPEGPARDAFRVNWKNIKGHWNQKLYEYFEEHAKTEGYAPVDAFGNFAFEDGRELFELFFKRLTAIRDSIVQQKPRENETTAAAAMRYELQKNAARARARVNSRREVVRCPFLHSFALFH
ncbi:hypothetical protein CVT24_006681 [Panaeolus cyanescens]|uniref:Uncharacterized protein n=1 Tax=Panaeolus cyanescens TaxID=181874 RepID=A0A409YRX6_9AGAR|nr:hypothetical protein CVT24_006681 [Panaeolus cyanescens]